MSKQLPPRKKTNAGSFKPGHAPIPGCGRKPGRPQKRSLALLEEAQRRGVEPAIVMFEAMEHCKARAAEAAAKKNPAEEHKYILEAAEIAYQAAPYCHSRLSNITVDSSSVHREERLLLLGQMSEEELLGRLRTKVIEHKPLRVVGGD